MPPTQQQFDFDTLSNERAAIERRKLLTRLAAALQGRSLGDPDKPKSRLSGSTVYAVLNGLHGWCVTEGWTDRTVAEICPSFAVKTVERVLWYLQSDAAQACVAVTSFRSFNSPRSERWICWNELRAWVEQLEADPVPLRTAMKRGPKSQSTPSLRVVDPLAASGSYPRMRGGDPLAASVSYNEDGPSMVQMVPPMGEESGGGGIPADLKPESGEPPDELSTAAVAAIADVRRDARNHPSGTQLVVPRRASGPRATPRPAVVRFDAGAAGVAPGGSFFVGRTASGHCSGFSQPSTLNPQHSLERLQRCEQLLRERLGIEAPEPCVRLALKHQSIDQVESVIQFAIEQEIAGVRPWEPGFVFARLTRATASPLAASEGWTKRSARWVAAKARSVERGRSEQVATRQALERELRQRRAEIEAAWGPVIDRLIDENPRGLIAALAVGDQALARSFGLRDRQIRDLLLLAALEGRLSPEVES